ncbi:MAG: mechanosensitive ion channel [Acidobacteria bacterium]|nr:MAG: mechanosensitive ion channel [Acidobacteriota bacterium]
MKLLLQVAGYELTGVAAVTAASILFLLILWLLKILFGRLCNRLDRWRDSGRAALKVKRFELLSVFSAHQLLTISLKVPRALVTLALLDVYVRFVLSQFEATRNILSEYGELIWGPLGQLGQAFLGYLPRLFQLLVLVVVAYFVLKLLYALFRSVQEGDVEIRGFYPDWAVPTYKLVRFFVLMLVVISALPLLPGSSSDTFRGVSIFVGVLVALASTSALGNVISGLALIYTRAFQIGDWVQIENSTGEVIRTSLIATRILTRQNVVVTVPNGKILGGHVSNFSAMTRKGQPLVVQVNVSVGYEVAWRRVHELLGAAAGDTQGVLTQPAPFVREESLDAFSVIYELNAFIDRPDSMQEIRAQLLRNVLDRFEQSGVELLTPDHMRVTQALESP